MGNVVGVTRQTAPEQLRELLIDSAKAVLDRQLTPAQANAISSLSSEVHKSIKMEMTGELIESHEKPVHAEYVGRLLGVGSP